MVAMVPRLIPQRPRKGKPNSSVSSRRSSKSMPDACTHRQLWAQVRDRCLIDSLQVMVKEPSIRVSSSREIKFLLISFTMTSTVMSTTMNTTRKSTVTNNSHPTSLVHVEQRKN